MRIVSSELPDTIVLPLGVTATELTDPLCPMKRKGLWLALKFQTMTVLSSEPLTTCFKLGLKQTDLTPSLWPLNDRFSEGSV